jgi:hypothetical protein
MLNAVTCALVAVKLEASGHVMVALCVAESDWKTTVSLPFFPVIVPCPSVIAMQGVESPGA